MICNLKKTTYKLEKGKAAAIKTGIEWLEKES